MRIIEYLAVTAFSLLIAYAVGTMAVSYINGLFEQATAVMEVKR